jgi:hypothetical protein
LKAPASNGVVAGFAGSHPDGLFNPRHEYLAIANVSRLTALANDLNRSFGLLVRKDEFDHYFGQKRGGIGRSAVYFGMPHLAANSLDFGYDEAGDADLLQGFAHLAEFEGLDDRDELFHGCPLGFHATAAKIGAKVSILRLSCSNSTFFRAMPGAAPLVRILFGLIFVTDLKLSYGGWIANARINALIIFMR